MSYVNRDKRVQGLGFRNYQEYLLSEEWKRIRKGLFYSGYVSRDSQGKLLCSGCGTSVKRPDVHHKSYQNLGYEYQAFRDLQVLCRECHSRVHKRGHTAKPQIKRAQL